ncbi:MAG: hypothetical protein KF910_01440 [Brevundimonas sp.]|uniref:hypothetical protein n=1 Tax=Brevundimonas sp. TaxID=1871086 RepID=UPI0025C20076|nr:hypothetical protein [Brevundimonas sp.]MBX3476246.1 hypothetical protein [Brevundimonas sp.]
MIALLIAVFAVPSVDAAVCATEGPAAASHVVDNHVSEEGAAGDEADDRGGGHGLCSHGHCHHGSVGRVDSSPETVKLTVTKGRSPFVDDNLTSYASEGLKRPPRA